jgi:SAM-dependent methyltransferase
MRCRICDNADGNQTYVVREMMLGTRDPFVYFQCRQCACLQIERYPDDISRYYPADYYAFRSDRPAARLRLKDRLRAARERYLVFGTGLVGRCYAALRPHSSLRRLSPLHLTAESRILDVGCGAGSFLRRLHGLGFKHLTGVDAFIPESRAYTEHYRILKSDLASVTGSFDFIVLNHSLEHMPNQAAQLAELARLLSPTGTCMIRVPVANSEAWERFGTDWVQLDAPRHYYLHSEKSLVLLANRAGLDLASIEYDSTGFQFVGSELYRRHIPLRESDGATARLFTRKQLRQFEADARQLNRLGRGDQAVFCFRKA